MRKELIHDKINLCLSEGDIMDETKIYSAEEFQDAAISETLKEVVAVLEERSYNPINQIVGYLMSGDPGYISNHKGARTKIMKIDRTKLLEILVKKFMEQ